MISSELEIAWKEFFPGSKRFCDVTGYEATEVGQEEGVDLFLPPEYRIWLPCGMIQVKPCFKFAREFLGCGYRRNAIIPVVIGDPPRIHSEALKFRILKDLKEKYYYCYKKSKAFLDLKPNDAKKFDYLLILICKDGVALKMERPKWAESLE